MENKVRVNRSDVGYSKEQLISFAKFLAPEIRKFYESEEGKTYYEEWLKSHPESAA